MAGQYSGRGTIDNAFAVPIQSAPMKPFLSYSSGGLVAIVCAAMVGCEVEPASDQGDELSISPSSIGLYPDQTVDLTASGGYEYTWSLSDGSIGFLSSTEGATVRYTNRSASTTNGGSTSSSPLIQTVTVVSSITTGSGGGGTNVIDVTSEDRVTVSATALIEHLFEEEEEDPEPDEELHISPDNVTLAQYGSQTFTATGGDGEYSWYLADDDWGRLTSTDTSETTYTLLENPGAGVTNIQVIYVVSGDQRASANIIQEGN